MYNLFVQHGHIVRFCNVGLVQQSTSRVVSVCVKLCTSTSKQYLTATDVVEVVSSCPPVFVFRETKKGVSKASRIAAHASSPHDR